MTATMNAFPVSANIRPAVDPFDAEAVDAANLASSRVVNTAGKYEDEFDDEVTLGDRLVDVRVCYPNNEGEVDVFITNDAALPVWPEISHQLSTKDRERLLVTAERLHEAKAEARSEGLLGI